MLDIFNTGGGSVAGRVVFWRRGCRFFGDGLVVALFGKESRFGCAHQVLLGILKAFPNRQSSLWVRAVELSVGMQRPSFCPGCL